MVMVVVVCLYRSMLYSKVTRLCIFCTFDAGSSLSEENGSHEGVEMLSSDDKLEIVSECWVEPVNGTVTNCASELSHFSDSVYSRIPDEVS